MMKILGIETSCDETAASVVEDGRRLISNVVASSMDLHVKYGGVVPEIAARSHIEVINSVIQQALEPLSGTTMQEKWDQIDGIAVTYGAGLGGSLLIGVMTAKSLAINFHKPLYGINHVEGHVYANFLTEIGSVNNSQLTINKGGQSHSTLENYTFPSRQPEFPMLAVIVSGGHSQLALFRNHFDYTLLGQTQDDAIGEAFDKVAKIIGLPYPGGPSVAKAAESGDPTKFKLPKAKMTGYDFSFSGLKTAVLRLAQAEIGESYDFPSMKLAERLTTTQKHDIAASFQRTAIETIVDKVKTAYQECSPASVVIAGGVAANQELRRHLSIALPLSVDYPDIKLCTDNGAMIATLGCYKALLDQPPADPYSLAINPNLTM